MGCANSAVKAGVTVPVNKAVTEDPCRRMQVLTSMVILMSKQKPEPARGSSMRVSQDNVQSPTPRDTISINQDHLPPQGLERLTKTTSLTPLKIQSGLSAFKAQIPVRIPSFQEFGSGDKQPKTPLRDDVRITERRKPSYDSPAVTGTRFGGRKSIVFKEPLTPNAPITKTSLKKSKTSRKSQLENLPLADYHTNSGVRITTLAKRRMTAVGGLSPQYFPQIGTSNKQSELTKSGGVTSKATDLLQSHVSNKAAPEQTPIGILKGSSSARRRLNSEILDRQSPASNQKLVLGHAATSEFLDSQQSSSIRPFHARTTSNPLGSQTGVRIIPRTGTSANLDTNVGSPGSPADIPQKSVQVVQSKKIILKPGQSRFDQLILEDSAKSEDDSVSIDQPDGKLEVKKSDKLNEDSYHSVKVEGFRENKGNPFTKPKVNREIKVTRPRNVNGNNEVDAI